MRQGKSVVRATNSNGNNSINQRPPQQRSLINSLFVNSNVKIAKCYLFNAQSIVNKLSELHHVMYVDNYDCINRNLVVDPHYKWPT